MSKISRSSSSSASSKSRRTSSASKAKKADAPKKSQESKSSKESKKSEEVKSTKDSFQRSAELKENDAAKKPGAAKGEGKEPKDVQDGKEPKDAKDAKDPKDAKDAKETEEKDALKEQLAKLEEELRALKEDREKKAEPKEDLGGCCGKPSGAKKAGEEENKDPNEELDRLASAILMGQQNGGKIPASAVQGSNEAKQTGKDGKNPVGGMVDVATARGTLRAKYQAAKQKGTQLRPEVEAKVQQALGMGGGMNPANGQPSGFGLTPANGGGANPGVAAGQNVARAA